MAHANAAFVLEIEADSYEQARDLVLKVAEESERVNTVDSYPEDEPHPDILNQGFLIEIDGDEYTWSYAPGAGGEYVGTREGLGFYIEEQAKKYSGRTSISEVKDIAEALEHFGNVSSQIESSKSVEGFVSVVTV